MDTTTQNYTATSVSSDAHSFFSTFEVLIQNIIRENNIKRCLIDRKTLQAEALEKDLVNKQERITTAQKEVLVKSRNIQQLQQSVTFRQSNLERLREHIGLLEEHENSVKRQITLKNMEANHRSDKLNALLKRAASMTEEYKKRYQNSTITAMVSKLRQTVISKYPQKFNTQGVDSRLDQSAVKTEEPMEILTNNDNEMEKSPPVESMEKTASGVVHLCTNHILNSTISVKSTQEIEDDSQPSDPNQFTEKSPLPEQGQNTGQMSMKTQSYTTDNATWLLDKRANLLETSVDGFSKHIQTHAEFKNEKRIEPEHTPSIPELQLNQTIRAEIDSPSEHCSPLIQAHAEVPECMNKKDTVEDEMVSCSSSIGMEVIHKSKGYKELLPFTSTPLLSQPPLKNALFNQKCTAGDEQKRYCQNSPSDCFTKESHSPSMANDEDEATLPCTLRTHIPPQPLLEEIEQEEKMPIGSQEQKGHQFGASHHIDEGSFPYKNGKSPIQSDAPAKLQCTPIPELSQLERASEVNPPHSKASGQDVKEPEKVSANHHRELLGCNRKEPEQRIDSDSSRASMVNNLDFKQPKIISESKICKRSDARDHSSTDAKTDTMGHVEKIAKADKDRADLFVQEDTDSGNHDEEPHGFNFESLFGNANKGEKSAAEFGGFWNDEESSQPDQETDGEFCFGNLFGKNTAGDEEPDEDGKSLYLGNFFAGGGNRDESGTEEAVSFWNGDTNENDAGKSEKNFFNIFNTKDDQREGSNENGLLF